MATTPNIPLLKTPRRFLFIASIGNPRPYRSTRHSAGHLLLDALIPHLLPRIPLVSSATSGQKPLENALFYKTWYSPSLMNVSGKKLVRELQQWVTTTQTEILEKAIQQGQVTLSPSVDPQTHPNPEKTPWQRRGIDPRTLRHFEPTLVILHDELEAPLGKVRVKRGGPEAFSLRGHRGLISIMEQLNAKKLYPPRTGPAQGFRGLSVLRIGVGIGRPVSREKGSVADYVLAEMNPKELAAVRAAVGPVLDALEDELYRESEPVKS